MKYRAEIDGLRALAVVPVILFHAGFGLFSGGFVGVDVFFVISGYLITTILIEDIEKNRFSIVHFYERRARRILPVLYVVVVLTLVTSYFALLPEDLVSLGKSAVSIPFFSSNFYFWSERGYFGGASELKPLVHTWSLAVEEQYYIVFPLILMMLRNYRKLLYSILTVGFFLSLGASYYVTLLHFDTAFYFPLTRAWELLVGAFCGIFLYKTSFRLTVFWADFTSIIGLLLIFYAYILFDSSTLFPYVNALIPAIGCALYIISSQNLYAVRKVFSNRAFVYVGLMSYSLYLWHQPLFVISRHLQLFENNQLVLIFTTFVLSILSFHFVEKPFRNKMMVPEKTLIKSALLGTVVIVVIGSIYTYTIGFPSRYAVEDRELLSQFASYKGYNQMRFDSAQYKQFSPSENYKVVLIGDSHAKDILNVVVESGKFSDYEFSTRQVNSECGNLLLENYDAIQKFISDTQKERCKVLGRYEGDKFQQILDAADEIWIVSAWKNWIVELLPESIENLNAAYNKPVRVFGLKNFGVIDARKSFSIPHDQRPTYTQPLKESSLTISSRMDNILELYDLYYPVMDKLCGGSKSQCQTFTPDGLLLSADGEHLTQEGAIEGAKRISDILLSLRTIQNR
jgi:peptidoglycan/LPS O-acetylase OafA/YrhL